jgi:MobA/VirD2-like, nuclease domain
MIIKGKSHSGRGLGAYLLQDKNDRAEVLGIRGDIPRDLIETLEDWRSASLGTNCTKPLYHAQLNPDRTLSREEWEKALAIYEKEMGFENQPRMMVLHEYKGREHMHLVYLRIDENGKAISDSWNYIHHEQAAREIERELGLEKTQGVFIDRDGERPERTHDQAALQQGERLKLNPKAVKAEISAIYRSADTGSAFVAGLEDSGYILAQGDSRAYVILDPAGGVHSLSRAATVKAADLRETLKEYPLQDLPTVEAAREIIHARQNERQQEQREKLEPQKEQATPRADFGKAALEATKPNEIDRIMARFEERHPDREPPVRAAQRIEHTTAATFHAAAKVAGRAADTLADVADRFMSAAADFLVGATPPRIITEAEYMANEQARREWRAQQEAQKIKEEHRTAALDRMRETRIAGRKIDCGELSHLNYADLQNIKAGGEATLLELIRSREIELERQRSRDRDRGGRER